MISQASRGAKRRDISLGNTNILKFIISLCLKDDHYQLLFADYPHRI